MAFTRSGVRSSLAPPFFRLTTRVLETRGAFTVYWRSRSSGEYPYHPLYELCAYRGKQACPMAFFTFDKLFCPRVAA